MRPGRNYPCPCGSGKKYKQCCYLKELSRAVVPVRQSPLRQDSAEPDMQDDSYAEQEFLINTLTNIRRVFLDKKPHIKEYYKTRNIHSEIVNTMIQYHNDGKFERRIESDTISEKKPRKLVLLESDFNLGTREGSQAFFDMLIYKTARNISCITDDFIRNDRYKKSEKTEFLHSMLDSKLGLFEVTGTDMKEGYAYIKDVFTGAEYKLIDIGLSGQQEYGNYYIYTRIITYRNINFGTGLNLIFPKTDRFIKNHIKEHKKDFHPDGEFLRFTQLYNYFSTNPNKTKIVTNEL
jgi:hypothetical protein